MIDFDLTKYKTQTEKKIAEFLRGRCENDNHLAMCCSKENKTICGAINYCKSEVVKLNENRQNCIMVDDETVFNWIIHYILEDELNYETETNEAVKVETETFIPEKKETKPKKQNTKIENQSGWLFDL